MLKDINWPKDRAFRSGSKNEPIQFYLDCLCNSSSFDLLLGYFSSAAISILSLGFASFLCGGGKLRMIVNKVLSKDDRDAIEIARDETINKGHIDLTNIKLLKRTLDEYGRHFFDCLAWLIANEKIQIVIIQP